MFTFKQKVLKEKINSDLLILGTFPTCPVVLLAISPSEAWASNLHPARKEAETEDPNGCLMSL